MELFEFVLRFHPKPWVKKDLNAHLNKYYKADDIDVKALLLIKLDNKLLKRFPEALQNFAARICEEQRKSCSEHVLK